MLVSATHQHGSAIGNTRPRLPGCPCPLPAQPTPLGTHQAPVRAPQGIRQTPTSLCPTHGCACVSPVPPSILPSPPTPSPCGCKSVLYGEIVFGHLWKMQSVTATLTGPWLDVRASFLTCTLHRPKLSGYHAANVFLWLQMTFTWSTRGSPCLSWFSSVPVLFFHPSGLCVSSGMKNTVSPFLMPHTRFQPCSLSLKLQSDLAKISTKIEISLFLIL